MDLKRIAKLEQALNPPVDGPPERTLEQRGLRLLYQVPMANGIVLNVAEEVHAAPGVTPALA